MISGGSWGRRARRNPCKVGSSMHLMHNGCLKSALCGPFTLWAQGKCPPSRPCKSATVYDRDNFLNNAAENINSNIFTTFYICQLYKKISLIKLFQCFWLKLSLKQE